MTTSGESARKPRRTFRTGLSIGLVTGVVFWAVALGGWFWMRSGLTPDFQVVVNGQDVTASGGRRVQVWNTDGGELTQACRDACDDLRVGGGVPGETGLTIRVVDAEGRAIRLEPGLENRYQDGLFPERFVIAGRPLGVKQESRSFFGDWE